ncbi:MAG: glycosyltransferase family 4 protein [Betaproteobacteria bacterium]
MVASPAAAAPPPRSRARPASGAQQPSSDPPLVAAARRAGVIAIVLKGYPRLSETFIAQELRALEQRGLALSLYSLRRPTDAERHPVHAEIVAPVAYLPEYLHDEPARVWRAWRIATRLPGYRAARNAWVKDVLRDCGRSRIRRFGQALVMAAEMPADVVHLHAHFLHTPASVTRYAAMMRGLAWSCSAHAKDIWTTPVWEKREKLAASAWTTTCTDANAHHLREIAGAAQRVELVYHGIDTRRFPAPAGARPTRDGSDPSHPVEVLAVGRAVDKKGFDDLLHALAALPPHLNWRLTHIGGGPLLHELEAAAHALGIAARVAWLGARSHAAVLDAYRAADLFALPCRVSADGDRDGLPNVLLEAQSQQLPCVSTHVSGIPELIEDGRTGLLVPPRDPPALAAALARLVADPALRLRLGHAGYLRATQAFSMEAGADRLAARFAQSIAVA